MAYKVRSLRIIQNIWLYYLSQSVHPCFVTKAKTLKRKYSYLMICNMCALQILRPHSLLLIIYLLQLQYMNTFLSFNKSFSNPPWYSHYLFTTTCSLCLVLQPDLDPRPYPVAFSSTWTLPVTYTLPPSIAYALAVVLTKLNLAVNVCLNMVYTSQPGHNSPPLRSLLTTQIPSISSTFPSLTLRLGWQPF